MAEEWKVKLEKRQEERLLELERKRQERAEQIRPEENPGLLLSRFAAEKEVIERMLGDLGHLDRSVLRDRLDEATKKLQELQKFLSDSFTFLPSYDVQSMQGQVDKLQQSLNDKRTSYMPKKKFAFSKKKVAGEASREMSSEKEQMSSQEINNSDPQHAAKTMDGEETITFITGQQITRCDNELLNRDISFSNLKECTISLYGSPLALHLENLESCKIFCGPISGAVFINNCSKCVFVFPCQQLRVHNTVKSQFYLLVTSRAIIEDCSDLGFAEFNWTYDGIEGHFETSRLDMTKNNWQLVDDFNWLNTDVHSPNWHIISGENKITSWQ